MFQLTKEQEKNSIMIYGKIIRCIIAPHHNYTQHQKELLAVMGGVNPDTVFVFPERDLTILQRKELLSVFANSSLKEINFITSDMFIIENMINDCCRLLNPNGVLEEVYEKTFLANIHNIRYNILEKYKEPNKSDQIAKNKIDGLIKTINNATAGLTANAKANLATEINLIGEEIISRKLLEMLSNVKTI